MLKPLYDDHNTSRSCFVVFLILFFLCFFFLATYIKQSLFSEYYLWLFEAQLHWWLLLLCASDLHCISSPVFIFTFVLLSQHQVFNYVHYVMTEDGYTDLEREELKDASLNSLKVGTKENDLVRGCGAGRQLPLPYLPLPTLLIPPPWVVIPLPSHEQFRAPV